jgi:dephospho-CoA kinase
VAVWLTSVFIHKHILPVKVIPVYATSLINLASFVIGTRMRVVGLTGGFACGKTLVSDHLKSKGATIIDVDEIGCTITEDVKFIKQLIRYFPDCFSKETGFKREQLQKLIEKDHKKHSRLNVITHRRIMEKVLWQIFYNRCLLFRSLVIIKTPLLHGGLLENLTSPIITVRIQDNDVWADRIVTKRNVPRKDADQLTKNQSELSEK